jgi:CrcB protein
MGLLERWLIISVGGAIGSIARYELGAWISSRWGAAFPWGTFVLNVTGSLVIGFVLAAATERLPLDPRWRFFVAVGFCGGYTTFSTFAYETAKLLAARDIAFAVANVAGSAVAGILAVIGGAALARSIW